MKTFLDFLSESAIGYEKKVRRTLQKASSSFSDIIVKRSKGRGAFSAHDVDVSIEVDKKQYDIEIKKNVRAQMGGISINYKDNEFSISKSDDFDDETIELILSSIKTKKRDIDKVIDYFRKNDPVFKYNKTVGFPLRVSSDVWTNAVSEGRVKSLNAAIKHSAEFINNYYKSKNVDYMQIGGSGLFYLASNPLKLDVPKLDGEIAIEFRAGKSGVKYNKQHDYEYSTVVLRLQGRLQFRGQSDYSLDKQSDVEELFSKIA